VGLKGRGRRRGFIPRLLLGVDIPYRLTRTGFKSWKRNGDCGSCGCLSRARKTLEVMNLGIENYAENGSIS
jgi:hypothetical protein